MLGQRIAVSEAQSHEVADSVSQTHSELLCKQAPNETLSARSNPPRPIDMDSPHFDGKAARTIVHWLLAVE